jgi:hypothetical protein
LRRIKAETDKEDEGDGEKRRAIVQDDGREHGARR